MFLLLLLARLPQLGELISHGDAIEVHLEALGDAVQCVERCRELPLVLDPPHQLLHGGRWLPGVHRHVVELRRHHLERRVEPRQRGVHIVHELEVQLLLILDFLRLGLVVPSLLVQS
jgi:hypothetical protein